MMRTVVLLAAILLALPASAKDLGVRGATWPVAEPDLLEEIEARLVGMQRSGELARLEEEARSRARRKLEEPEPVPGIAPAKEHRSRLLDPSIAVARDIRTPDGVLIAAAGARVKAIVIDEAWDLLSGEDSRAFLEGAARRARKYRGALITGTQSVNDYYANPAARAAWENSDWVIFLAQKDESVELLKQEKRIHCDPGMERALKSLTTADGRYAELVLHGPDGWRVARLVLDAWSVALFSSRGPAFAAVERLKAEGLTTVEAIDRLAGDALLAGNGARAPAGHSETTERKGESA